MKGAIYCTRVRITQGSFRGKRGRGPEAAAAERFLFMARAGAWGLIPVFAATMGSG